MTAPTAEKVERKTEATPVAETTQAAPTEEFASLGLSVPLAGLAGPAGGRLDPRQAIALQRAAGNGAVASMIQRAPPDATPKPPLPGKRERSFDEQLNPAFLSDGHPLPSAITDFVPRILSGINGARYKAVKGTGLAHGATQDEALWSGSVSVARLFADDVIYNFSGNGKLLDVESNLSAPVDPAKPNELPAPKFPLPDQGLVIISEPATKRKWQAFRQNSGRLEMLPFSGTLSLPEGLSGGQLIVFIYAPGHSAAEEGGPLPGYKAKDLTGAKDPDWAKAQYKAVTRALKGGPATKPGKEPAGTGAGLQGEGPGGGGRDPLGRGTAKVGEGIGAARADGGQGRGREKRPKDRAKPDKVVLWSDANGSNVNVWVGKSHESLPLKEGESDKDLQQRVEEAAARQRSTGERIADGASTTGFVGGEGTNADAQEIAEASEFTANALSYPSRMEMQASSGADVSPSGWGTTVAGAMHNFDMMLDWDARQFGLANQTFARLGWVHYYWQVIDVGKLDFKDDSGEATSRTRGPYESEDAYRKRMRKEAVAGAEDSDNVRKAKVLDTFWAKGRNETIRQGEGIEKDSPTFHRDDHPVVWAGKAAKLAAIGVSAVWNIGKALIGGWVQKVTEPENRREIEFGQPGEYLIRCIANPVPDKDKPYDKQTRRASSIAVFPVRVVDVNSRAREVTHEDMSQLDQARQLLAAAQKDLAADPKNESLQIAVQMAQRMVGLQQTANNYSTVEKIGQELEDYDVQITVLEKLSKIKKELGPQGAVPETSLKALTGNELVVGLDLKRDISLRFKRGPNGYVDWFDYEFHLHDVKEARKKKAEQKEVAEKKEGEVAPGTALRPRVTFVSEENGALVRMDMILGQAKTSKSEKPSWVLADVTTTTTARSYSGESSKAGAPGEVEAITKTFEAFAEKAEYGRGTISIEIPGRPDLINPGMTMLMQPGAKERWIKRLRDLIEIAGLVAPYAKGGAMLGKLAGIGGALDAGSRLYDRAVNDRLKANFETLADVVAILGPLAHGATALSESKLLRGTRGGAFALQTFAKGSEIANEFIMPATFVHDLDALMKDTSLGGPEKEAAIAMLFGRGLRDGVVQYVKVGAPHAYGTELHVPGDAGGASHQPGAPVQQQTPRVEPTSTGPIERGAPPPEPAPRRTDIDGRFDNSDQQTVGPAKAKQTEAAPRAAQSETPPAEPTIKEPQTDIPAEHLGIEPGSALDTPRGRANRAEQMRRAAAWQVDAATVEHGTRPDARARARAADFTPMYAKWTQLKAQGRKAHIETVINAHLAREGIPPVTVKFGAKRPGNAEFAAHEWTITLSDEVVSGDHVTAEAFATLIDNAVHETGHTVTTFRGVRMALATKGYHPQAHIPGKIVGEALAANNRKPVDREFDETTRGEALEIYQIQVEPRVEGPMPKEALDRDAVYARMDAAKEGVASAKALHDFNVGELAKNPTDPDAIRHEAESRAALEHAQSDQIAAHNAYVALPEETFSHRSGGAAKNAVLERLALESRRNDARKESSVAAAEQRVKRVIGDVKGAGEALKRSVKAELDARKAQAEIDALTSDEPGLVGGNIDRRGTPLTKKEMAAAPNAPSTGYVQPGELARRVGKSEPSKGGAGRSAPADAPVAVPKSAEASPAPGGGGAKFAPTGAAVETGAEAVRVAAKQGEWAGRATGSDLPAGTVKPSAGTGVQYENRRGRYEVIGKPKGGTSDSQIVKDRATGELFLFKPKTGEKHVPTAAERGVQPGEYAPRAKASEIATHELGLDTPGVELVELEGGTGSLTKWIEPKNKTKPELMSLADYLRPTEKTSDLEADQRLDDLKGKPEFQEAWNNIQALDYLINNVDRYQNFGNYLIEFTPSGEFLRLTPIDSELSYTTTEGRAVIEKKTSFLEDISYTQTMADKVRELGKNRAAFADKIRPLVGDAAVEGVMTRLDQLITDANKKMPAKVPVGAGATP